MPCCTPKCKKWTVFSLGTLFILLGLLVVLFWSDLVDTIKYNELSLSSEDSTEYKMWKETPIPMYIEFYLFNWTNVHEVIASNWKIKPSFNEMGPYTYSEHHIRKAIVFNHNNHTLTFKTQRIWHFVPAMSLGSLDDQITTINPILATVGAIVKYKHPIVQMGVNFFLEEKRVNLTVTKSAREFIFDGYEDPMLDLLKKLHLKHIDIPFVKFGWFAGRNGSIDYDGIWNMYDGSDDIEKLGITTSWNFQNHTNYYSNHCGDVNGTNGELWYPVRDAKSVDIFASDICSSLTFVHGGEDELFGISGHKYVANAKLLDNGTKYPEMACFSPGEAVPSGVRNVSECKFGAPAFVSYPHFYLADPYYREAVDGMHPNKSKHEFFISVEPETGIPLQVQVAMQINLRIEKIGRITLLENVKMHFFPCMWFKQYAKLSEGLANQAKMILILPAIGTYTGYGILGLGCFLLVIFVVITLKNQWRGSDEDVLLSQDKI